MRGEHLIAAIIMVHKYGLETDSILALLAAILESEALAPTAGRSFKHKRSSLKP